MNYDGKQIDFPAEVKVSFFKIIEYLEKEAKSSNSEWSNYVKSVLNDLSKFPELKDGINPGVDLKKYDDVIGKLDKFLIPEILSSNEIKIVTSLDFYTTEPLLMSNRFASIIEASGKPYEHSMPEMDEESLYMGCCYYILGAYYGYPIFAGSSQIIEIFNKNQGITRAYKMLTNAELMEFIPTKKAINITENDYKELINNFDNIDLWKEKFPPNSWVLRGVSVINLVDITIDFSINSITSSLLINDEDTFLKIQGWIQRILGLSDLQMGVFIIEDHNFETVDESNSKSILLHNTDKLNYIDTLDTEIHQKLLVDKSPYVITDVEDFHKKNKSNFSQQIFSSGIKSYLLMPLIHENHLLGYLELGSQRAYSFHKGVFMILEKIVPTISLASYRYNTEMQNSIEAIIQQECTTIHPSVKWKFEDEARIYIENQISGKQYLFKDIAFKNLYPLYGQIDIKSSSKKRNDALQHDLTLQLSALIKVFEIVFHKTEMPIYEELLIRAKEFKTELKTEVSARIENKILSFLKTEVYPVFEHLIKIDSQLKIHINEYRSLLSTEHQTVYIERKKYDDFVTVINNKLATFLDQKQEEAQQMFPHYFERYKTDGVEFNMYIGQSIAKNKAFNKVYVKNLRLWQLLTMCQMEYEYRKIREKMKVSIEVASLILVYNTPISVHFRLDEKKFDVEGSYNARYEIIKKRIDKAHIKGTNERITQPENIVVVYAQDRDAEEYTTYLKYLIHKRYLQEDIEDHELEDLQGVSGLKALRVKINYNQAEKIQLKEALDYNIN